MLSFLICGLHFFLEIASSTKSINIYEDSMQHVINNELKGTCFLHLNENISKENKAFEKTKLNCF